MTTSRQVRLARRPAGEPDDATFSIEDHELPSLEDGQLLLRVVYLSLDPYMRGRLSDAPSYADPVAVGDVIVGGTVCVVEESRDPSYAAGRRGAVVLRLADARDRRRQARPQARPRGGTDLHRRSA